MAKSGSAIPCNEFQGSAAGLVIRELLRRRLHEVARGAYQRSANAAVERKLGATHGINHHSGRVGRIPDLELHLEVERHASKGGALQPDIGPLAIGEPWNVVARTDMNAAIGQRYIELAEYGLCLGNFLRFQALAFKHVLEVGVSAEVELIRAIEPNAAFAKEIDQHAMQDGCADLAFYIVANQGKPASFELAAPEWIRRDEDRDAVDEGASGLQRAARIPFARPPRSNGEI